jgi:hypothetical protein
MIRTMASVGDKSNAAKAASLLRRFEPVMKAMAEVKRKVIRRKGSKKANSKRRGRSAKSRRSKSRSRSRSRSRRDINNIGWSPSSVTSRSRRRTTTPTNPLWSDRYFDNDGDPFDADILGYIAQVGARRMEAPKLPAPQWIEGQDAAVRSGSSYVAPTSQEPAVVTSAPLLQNPTPRSAVSSAASDDLQSRVSEMSDRSGRTERSRRTARSVTTRTTETTSSAYSGESLYTITDRVGYGVPAAPVTNHQHPSTASVPSSWGNVWGLMSFIDFVCRSCHQGLPPWYVSRQQQGRVQYVTPQPPPVVTYPQLLPAQRLPHDPVPQWQDKPARLQSQPPQPQPQFFGIPPAIQDMVAAVSQRQLQPSRVEVPPTVVFAPPSIAPPTTPMIPVSVSRGGSVTATAPQYQVFNTTMGMQTTSPLPLPLADPSHTTPTPPTTFVMVASPSAGAPSQLPHPLIVMQPSLTPQVLPDPLYEEKVSEGDDDNDDSGVSSC